MIDVLFFVVLAIVALQLVWDVLCVIVAVYQVQKNEEADDPTEYECGFSWKGEQRYGYFFADEKPDEGQFFEIIGYDPNLDAWMLEVYKPKK